MKGKKENERIELKMSVIFSYIQNNVGGRFFEVSIQFIE